MAKKSKKITVAVSGGFDPVHIGHVRLFKEAKKLGDKLIVILNNDNWLKRKKINIFMPQKERKEIIESITWVDKVILTRHSPNTDDISVARELMEIRPDIFANGGDRKNIKDIPEGNLCNKIGCKLVFNVGRGGKIQSSSWLLGRYVANLKTPQKIDRNSMLDEIERSLLGSSIIIPMNLKLKVAETILELMGRERGFGLFIILGWKNKWNSYLVFSDPKQDIYDKHHINITSERWYKSHYDISETVDFDGAILINRKGDIIHSGAIIEGLKPKLIAQKINPGRFEDISTQFGFKAKVHSRHLSAITASYLFKGTTVFTVSEENDALHIFENGRIVYRNIP